MSDIRSEISRQFIKFSKFKVTLIDEETGEVGNKYFVGSYVLSLQNGIYGVTYVGVEIIMYIQIFILVKAAFFLEGIQRSSLIIKTRANKARQIF